VNKEDGHDQSQGSAALKQLQPNEFIEHLANGQAALMLVESLLLLLIEKHVLTNAQIVEAVETAIDTKRQLGEEGENIAISSTAAGTMSNIANSLAATKAKNPRDF
jgi:hypothetical protein